MVDSYHARYESDWRYRTGYTIYVQNALIYWLSKKQATVEKDILGSKFVAMIHRVETLHRICYKIHIMGVQIDDLTYIFGDNKFVILNTSRPEPQLRNKFNSICYHAVRETVAVGKCMTTHIPTLLNFADLLTKVLHGSKRRRFLNGILFDIYEYDWSLIGFNFWITSLTLKWQPWGECKKNCLNRGSLIYRHGRKWRHGACLLRGITEKRWLN